MLTQGIAGIPNKDTTVWIVYYEMEHEWKAENWKGIGGAGMKLIASMVKLDAPDAKVQIKPA